jgi:hypothetical protein
MDSFSGELPLQFLVHELAYTRRAVPASALDRADGLAGGSVQSLLERSFVFIPTVHGGTKGDRDDPFQQCRNALLLLPRGFLQSVLHMRGNPPTIDLGFRHALRCSATALGQQPYCYSINL